MKVILRLKKYISTFILLSLLTVSCWNADSPIEKERKARQKLLDGNIVLLYKAIKISLRAQALPAMKTVKNGSYEKVEYPDSVNKLLDSLQHSFSKILDLVLEDEQDKQKEISIKDFYQIVKDIFKLRKVLQSKDEDDYPGMLEQLFILNNNNYTPEQQEKRLKIFRKYLSLSHEHLFFAAITLPHPATTKLAVYEVSKVKKAELADPVTQLSYHQISAWVYLWHDWLYLSEESSTEAIELMENSRDQLIEIFKLYNIQSVYRKNPEQFLLLLKGVTHLMRGLARYQMDEKNKHQQAIQDFEVFIETSEKIGMDNEIVWLMASFVYSSQGKKAKAISYLDKLVKSANLTQKEKKVILDIKAYISKRDSESKLNFVFDKVFVVKLVLKLLYSEFKNSEYYKNLTKEPAFQKAIELQEKINELFSKFNFDMDLSQYNPLKK